jgi:hypothetical protein
MSTRIGTLEQKKRIKMWPIVAALLAVAALATYLTLKPADRDSTRKPAAVSQTVSGTAANTPSELSGGVIGGITSEATQPNDQVGRRNVTPRVGVVAPSANTPSEVGEIITVGGTTKASFHPLP